MSFQRLMSSKMILAVLLTLVMIPPTTSCGGTISFNFSIDTSSFSGTSGDVEFQLGSSGSTIPSPITATFDQYSSNATLDGPTGYLIAPNPPATTMGGNLIDNTLSLYNDDSAQQTADADQLVSSFGSFLNFRITLSGDGIGSPSDSTPSLAISVFNSLNQPLFNGPVGTNYAAAFYQIETDGTVTPTIFGLASVPEPGSLALLGIGICFIGSVSLKRTFFRTGNVTPVHHYRQSMTRKIPSLWAICAGRASNRSR